MDMSGQLHAPVSLPPWKEPIEEEAGWAPEPVWTLWRRGKSLPLPGIEFGVHMFELKVVLRI
jgi:hypothetical protein